MIQSILFDLIGTTVREEGDVVMQSFAHAFGEHTGDIDAGLLRQLRGKEKKEMIRSVLHHHQYDLSLVDAVYTSFERELDKRLAQFCEMPGASDVFVELNRKGIQLGLGTGLERAFLDKIFHQLGWDKNWFSYIAGSNEMKHSRPSPDMITDMMNRTGSKGGASFLKLGDTVADIQEGKNAGVLTAVILSGSQSKEELMRENPDYILTELTEIMQVVNL
jgi:phosphonoacetaldehyde hydrolase